MRRTADRFMADTAHYAAASTRTLDRILALNGRTEFARSRGLDGPNPRQVFEKLPLTTYADYSAYVERTAAGEQNVLSGEPVIYFSTTSGTTGPPKMVPVTRRQMRMAVGTRMTSMGLALRAGVLKPMRGRFMTMITEHVSGATSGGLPMGAATTGGFRQLGNFADKILTSPPEVMRVHDQAASRYLHLLFGLGEERLWTMIAFFPATVLFTLRTLEAQKENLVRDLADGTLNTELELPKETRARLLRLRRPDRARARALTALLDRGQFTPARIWPDLGAILTATGGAFGFYIDQLRPLLDGVRVFSPVYSASEGTMGYGFSADKPFYLMVSSLAYVELLQVDQMNDPKARPIPAWQAKPGTEYEVVITTLAGFTRYRLHDIVRVVEMCGQTPVYEFVERSGQVLDIAGEKTAEHHVVEAIELAGHDVNLPLVDYFVTIDTETAPGRYLLVIESTRTGPGLAELARQFLQAAEAALHKTAFYYDEDRNLGILASMAMVVLKPGAFERYRDRCVAAGASASQVKTPHVVLDQEFLSREMRDEVLFQVEDASK
ncbi:MAG: GH3 auxin-responsive promoter family protein [Gammaproteobacteria bacterium]|nr:GH3 auxin-responsive promoter family protein [Gammaproteobacteria bacterium]